MSYKKPTKKQIFSIPKRRGAAEVISSVLLIAITIVGAVILTSFMDETFVSGSLGVSGSDSSIKSVKLLGYDTRDGTTLMGIQNLNNTTPTNQYLCRNTCFPNTSPLLNGTEFVVLQIENNGVNPIFLHNVYLDGVNHTWDSSTSNAVLDVSGSFGSGNFPGDGSFSILALSDRCNNRQCDDNQILDGETVNLVIKLDQTNDDIPLSKTIRAQFNIGDNTLSESIIETGGAS